MWRRASVTADVCTAGTRRAAGCRARELCAAAAARGGHSSRAEAAVAEGR